MSLTRLIEKNVEKAFKLSGDLVKRATFKKKTAQGFNFGSAEPQSTASVDVHEDVLMQVRAKRENVAQSVLIILNVSRVGELSQYSEVILDGFHWTIGPTILSNGFVKTIELYRGAPYV